MVKFIRDTRELASGAAVRNDAIMLSDILWLEPLIWLALLAAALGACLLLRRRAASRTVNSELASLITELSNLSRNVNEQLDSRTAHLELLLKQADQKIAALQSAPSRTQAGSEGTPEEADRFHDDVPHEPIPDSRHTDIYTLADQGRSTKEIAQRLGRPSGEIELILALRPRA
jgi:hypothetical protein